jgi:hypothetical protein
VSLNEPTKVQDGDDKQTAVLDTVPAGATVASSEEDKVMVFEAIP